MSSPSDVSQSEYATADRRPPTAELPHFISRRRLLASFASGSAIAALSGWWLGGVDDRRHLVGTDSVPEVPGTLRAFYPALVNPSTQKDRNAIRKKLWLRSNMSFSDLLHWLRLFGNEAEKDKAHQEVESVIADITDVRRLEQRYRMPPSLVETPYGKRYLAANWNERNPQLGRGTHPYQALAVFAEIGLPRSTPLFMADSIGSVDQLLQDCLLNMQFREAENAEPEWAAMAVALYLPPVRTWCNRWGELLDFDSLAQFLLDRPLQRYSCQGTHMLSTAATLLQIDGEEGVLDRSVRRKIEMLCDDMSVRLRRSQRHNGSWGNDWLGDSVPNQEPPWAEVHVTGHVMEYQFLLPDSLQAPPDYLHKAVRFLIEALKRAKDREIAESYCPYSHAGRVILGWPIEGSDR